MKEKKKIKVLGIIPARGGSTSIPRKNIIDVAGKPLIYYSIKEAQKSKLLDAFIVSTDDAEIAKVAQSFGADVPFLRPKKFARKYSAEIEYMRHALDWVAKNRGWYPEIVVAIKPTSPLRPAKDIDRVIRLLKKGKFSMARTMIKSRHHPYRTWKFNKKTSEFIPLLPNLVSPKDFKIWGNDVPRQKLTDAYTQNGAVDATWVKNIKKGASAVFAGPIGGIIVDPETSIDIDEPEDLEILARIIKKRRANK